MKTMVELASSILVESSQMVIVESEKANFRPFGQAEYAGYGGAETNAAVPVPLIHDHGDLGRIVVAGNPDDKNAVNIEVHTMGKSDDEDMKGSAIVAHKDTWMHKASLAKNALALHGDDHEAVHNSLKAHGFERTF